MTPEAIAIRDSAADLLRPSELFKTVTLIPHDAEPDELSLLSVLAWRDQLQADGDPNTGPPHFKHELTLAIQVKVMANSREALDAKLTRRTQLVLNTLLRSPGWLAQLEGVGAAAISVDYSRNGETWFGSATIELQVLYRSWWEPEVLDDYKRTRMTTRPYGHDEGTPGITSVIDAADDDEP
ncbi:hypothetical protein [Chelatococcus reniformis]|uniref:Uncharacterized protein n=1 Tax=Chelatococcus reniformis TaxID=1494448 RepID=A0A916UEZ2_9HYPH|nr:hypothetical protein [Chelatococcus reniformis]GGC68543.1 hypothetical protein GCM10010994_28920 [Chelatococcus reniformis]